MMSLFLIQRPVTVIYPTAFAHTSQTIVSGNTTGTGGRRFWEGRHSYVVPEWMGDVLVMHLALCCSANNRLSFLDGDPAGNLAPPKEKCKAKKGTPRMGVAVRSDKLARAGKLSPPVLHL
jgi:hypothetical protein